MSANHLVPPIPAFYACYLLRSAKRHASQYVGSTPNPLRRLRQHNGVTKGGAAKTSRSTLRPWEMVTLVTGFPSSVAALQFEWAWQNTHLTRHISPASRITQARSNVRISPKTGRTRQRPARPRMSLTDRLANLHVLLSCTSFQRWPLKVTFYAKDVHMVWEKWTKHQQVELRPGVEVSLDDSSPLATSLDDPLPPSAHAVQNLDVGYGGLKPHIEKARKALDDAEWLQCSVCASGLSAHGHGTLICPRDGCEAMSHLTCLSTVFLQAEKQNDALIPTVGHCPGCNTELNWIDLVKELALRMRGSKQIEDIFKQRRVRKGGHNAQSLEQPSDGDLSVNSEAESLELETAEDNGHEWNTAQSQAAMARSTPERVIEDSEWDDALLLT